LVFTARCTSVQILGVKRGRSSLHRNMSCWNATSRPLLSARTRRTAASASGPARAFPMPPLPEARSTPRRLEVIPYHVSRLPSPVGHAAKDRRSLLYRAARAAYDVLPAVWTPSLPSLFLASQVGRTTAIRGAPQGVPARPLFRG
jgi:hypothetical protein